MIKIFEKLKSGVSSSLNKKKVGVSPQKKESRQDYYTRVKSWADESRAQTEVTLSWFKLGFASSMGLNILLVIAVVGLSSVQTLVPLLVHQYDNGITTVDAINDDAPHNKAQVQSDLVRYIQNRESFDTTSYKAQFDITNLLSDEQVANEYQRGQVKTNPEAPINTVGLHKYRKVHVYSVSFLDNVLRSAGKGAKGKSHQNLAEVVFSVTDVNKITGESKTTHKNALISWRYNGIPKSPEVRWKNWSGFKITSYHASQRNVENQG